MATNHLLNSIPVGDLRQMDGMLERVHLNPHDEIISADTPIAYVHFPQTCMISLVTLLENGTQIEAATVGNEGVVGLSVFLGLEEVNTRALCQMPGEALRMSTRDFKAAISTSASLRVALGLYAHAFIAMLTQAGACNGSHQVEQRLARWLLTIADRVESDRFSITQEFLAQMLGSHRPTVTLAVEALQKSGAISTRRAEINIVDRTALEATACECYQIIRVLYEETFKRVGASIAKVSTQR